MANLLYSLAMIVSKALFLQLKLYGKSLVGIFHFMTASPNRKGGLINFGN